MHLLSKIKEWNLHWKIYYRILLSICVRDFILPENYLMSSISSSFRYCSSFFVPIRAIEHDADDEDDEELAEEVPASLQFISHHESGVQQSVHCHWSVAPIRNDCKASIEKVYNVTSWFVPLPEPLCKHQVSVRLVFERYKARYFWPARSPHRLYKVRDLSHLELFPIPSCSNLNDASARDCFCNW